MDDAMKLRIVIMPAVLLAALTYNQSATAAASCESLASLMLPHTRITRAQLVPAGAFAATPAGVLAPGAPSFRPYNMLPAFCRGYAVAATDTGHTSRDGSFAFNHPEKLIDFSYRAVHEMTVQAKALVNAYYGKAPSASYWDGCSTGGRQGLKEAQRYPADYDGIVAGTPTNYMTHMLAQSLWVAHATLKDSASYIPEEKYALIHKAVLDACDSLDGVKDGVIDDPTRCHFDTKTIQCGADDAPACLTAAQVEATRKIYGSVKNPRTGVEIFPGLEPGSELGWAGLAGGPNPMSIATDYFKYVVFKNLAWDFRMFDFDKDVALADTMDNGADNATDPNLKAFFTRGGKLLMYHGWNDPLVAPRNSINYYTSVNNALGGAANVNDSMRLFMVPGMGHCVGGDGPSNFDKLTVIEQWVKHKKAPDQIGISGERRIQILTVRRS